MRTPSAARWKPLLPASLENSHPFDTTSPLFQSLPAEAVTWMSHVDYVGALPEGFVSIAHTDHCPVAAMQNLEKKVFGFQYHPEVEHTENGSGSCATSCTTSAALWATGA